MCAPLPHCSPPQQCSPPSLPPPPVLSVPSMMVQGFLRYGQRALTPELRVGTTFLTGSLDDPRASKKRLNGKAYIIAPPRVFHLNGGDQQGWDPKIPLWLRQFSAPHPPAASAPRSPPPGPLSFSLFSAAFHFSVGKQFPPPYFLFAALQKMVRTHFSAH